MGEHIMSLPREEYDFIIKRDKDHKETIKKLRLQHEEELEKLHKVVHESMNGVIAFDNQDIGPYGQTRRHYDNRVTKEYTYYNDRYMLFHGTEEVKDFFKKYVLDMDNFRKYKINNTKYLSKLRQILATTRPEMNSFGTRRTLINDIYEDLNGLGLTNE